MWEKMEAKFLKFKMFHIFWQWKASAALSFSLSLSRTTALSLSHTLPLTPSIYLSRTRSSLPFPNTLQSFTKLLSHSGSRFTHTRSLSLLLSSLPLSRSHRFLWILAVGWNLEDPTFLGLFWFFAAWSQNRRSHSFRLNLKRTKAMKNWFDLKTTRWNTYRSLFRWVHSVGSLLKYLNDISCLETNV